MAQPNQKAEVVLGEDERKQLEALVRDGTAAARRVRQARILLMADEDRREGRNPDWYIAQCVGISERQVCRIRRRFVSEGISAVLNRKPRSDAGVARKLDGAVEARLITLCCSTPPEGRQRWTLQLLVDELCRLQVVTCVCRETVRQTLKKIASSRGRRNASAFRKPTTPGSSRTLRKSWTSTRQNTAPRIR